VSRVQYSCLVISLLAFASSTQAVTPAVIVGTDLKGQQVKITSLSRGRISYFDNSRTLQYQQVHQILRIQFSTPTPNPPRNEDQSIDMTTRHHQQSKTVIELFDGQYLIGEWTGGDDQQIKWQQHELGELHINLDQIRSVSLSMPPPRVPSGSADRIWLTNGDMIEGFIERLSGKTIIYQPLTAHSKQQGVVLPAKKLRAFTLIRPGYNRDSSVASLRRQTHLVWLTDGSRLAATNLGIRRGFLFFKPALLDVNSLISVPIDSVIMIDIACVSGYLRNLADLNMKVEMGGTVFGLAWPPTWFEQRLSAHAPVVTQWTLPKNASRFTASVKLTEQTRQAEKWADLDLVLRVDDRIIERYHINASTPQIFINTPLSGHTMSIELHEAANGPVMDRVEISEAVIFVSHP